MKWLLIILLLLNSACAQQKATNIAYKLDSNYSLIFKNYNKNYKLYNKIYIKQKKFNYAIKGFDANNYTSPSSIKPSPNKKYIVLDYIIKGYVFNGTEQVLHENYLCVIISLRDKKVVSQLQSGCGGQWTPDNLWVDKDEVLFNGDD